MRPLPVIPLLLLAACASPDTSEPAPPPTPAEVTQARHRDIVNRVGERISRPDRMTPDELFHQIERLMPTWQAEQRHGRQQPVEAILTQDVVSHFDMVLAAFHDGSHERQVVAAWSLGFSRVPDNDVGVPSPHPQAVGALVGRVETADDELMRNIMLALWRIGDENTPMEPLLSVLERHHDPDCRANASLAISAIITDRNAFTVMDDVVVALGDPAPKVRLHATTIARMYPHPIYTARLQTLLPDEAMPLVQANMADALGRAGDRSSAKLILPLLDSDHDVVRGFAHRALVTLLGVDRGTDPDAWRDLIY